MCPMNLLQIQKSGSASNTQYWQIQNSLIKTRNAGASSNSSKPSKSSNWWIGNPPKMKRLILRVKGMHDIDFLMTFVNASRSSNESISSNKPSSLALSLDNILLCNRNNCDAGDDGRSYVESTLIKAIAEDGTEDIYKSITKNNCVFILICTCWRSFLTRAFPQLQFRVIRTQLMQFLWWHSLLVITSQRPCTKKEERGRKNSYRGKGWQSWR